MFQVFRPLADQRMHVLTDADDNVNNNSDISLAFDALLSEHRGCPTEVSFCCTIGFSVDFEKDPVSINVVTVLAYKNNADDSNRNYYRAIPLIIKSSKQGLRSRSPCTPAESCITRLP